MDGFQYKGGRLFCEGAPVESMAARWGTPLYVYSRAALLARLGELRLAFRPARPLICYSVKANSNISILGLLAGAGCGFDIVSGGELYRALKAGAAPSKVVFAGVGKTPDEIAQAIHAVVRMFNVESEPELAAAHAVAARMGHRPNVVLRLNPDVDARTHAKTTTGRKENKFGIDMPRAYRIFADRSRFPHLRLSGIHLHLGSPIYSTAPFRDALRKVGRFVRDIRGLGVRLRTLNLGGGYCISYDGRPVIQPADYAAAILPAVRDLGMKLIIEPGRYIVGNSGILLTRVIYVKEGWLGRKFVIVDAGMNDLIRPALYEAYHNIQPAFQASGPGGSKPALERVDISGRYARLATALRATGDCRA